MFEVFKHSDPQTWSLQIFGPRDTPRPFLLFSFISFISLIYSICLWFVFDMYLTYIDIQLTFNGTLYVGLYIRLCQQDNPHSFLFGSPARYVIYFSSLLCNWTSSDPPLVLFEALKCAWHFEHFFRLQLPLQCQVKRQVLIQHLLRKLKQCSEHRLSKQHCLTNV